MSDATKEAIHQLVNAAGDQVAAMKKEKQVNGQTEQTQPTEHILQFFAYQHLPPHLQMISRPFCDLAHAIVRGDNVAEAGTVTIGPPLPRNPERTVALRKLLEAKDAAVRALIAKES
jgi:hypothetical protein